MTSPKPTSLIRPLVRRLHPYVPGEQPRIRGLIKLNTNENPYPPSPKVLAAIKAAVDGRMRLYPNPTAEGLRGQLAEHHGCAPGQLIVGNGSDELLALATRAFVEPGQTVQFFTPSYSLYPVLADIHGARCNAVPLASDFALPSVSELRKGGGWDFRAPLSFITTPNAPTGRGYRTSELQDLCRAQKGVVVLDEAYVDFANENAFSLALKFPHVLVARTFSKAYSLCFLRVGYMAGAAPLIEALHKIRDSYNVNGLGQVAAAETLRHLPYYRRNFQRLIATRERLSDQLRALGFDVLPSQTNFIFVRPPRFPAGAWLRALREKRVLTRWFDAPATRDFLRITIGTDSEAKALVQAARKILAQD
jgi:histidinol-phosphate aminotransferase